MEKNASTSEGPVAHTIEEQTGKLPSDILLWAAISSTGISLTLKIFRKKHNALFVGQLAAPFHLLGIYNKLVNGGPNEASADDLEHA